ncbi:hypothetical protein RJG79_00880 [Mycoplasmatota bacterium WC44]
MKENYFVSSVTRICTIIALILDGISVLTLILFTAYIDNFLEFIVKFDSTNIYQILELENMIKSILIFGMIFSIIFFIINLIFFIKLINKKVSLKAAKGITIYQIVYGVITLGGNTISAILYLISGLNSHSNLTPAIKNQNNEEY